LELEGIGECYDVVDKIIDPRLFELIPLGSSYEWAEK
jgi:hypothetical protein